jgi:hypothetical protein
LSSITEGKMNLNIFRFRKKSVLGGEYDVKIENSKKLSTIYSEQIISISIIELGI